MGCVGLRRGRGPKRLPEPRCAVAGLLMLWRNDDQQGVLVLAFFRKARCLGIGPGVAGSAEIVATVGWSRMLRRGPPYLWTKGTRRLSPRRS